MFAGVRKINKKNTQIVNLLKKNRVFSLSRVFAAGWVLKGVNKVQAKKG